MQSESERKLIKYHNEANYNQFQYNSAKNALVIDRGSPYSANNDKTFQPKNVAQIISGNVLALERNKQTQNYGSNMAKLRDIP